LEVWGGTGKIDKRDWQAGINSIAY
jgi:hypothetical protein